MWLVWLHPGVFCPWLIYRYTLILFMFSRPCTDTDIGTGTAPLQSRERLNNAWSAVQRSTYYKSLDRRSLDLKHEDKKAHVPKALVADMTHRWGVVGDNVSDLL